MNKITVLLVDDHAVVRAGFNMLLSMSDNIVVVAEAERGESVCQLYQDNKPDVVVLDLSMPGIGGLECIRRLRGRDPCAKILVFSVHDEAVYVSRALDAGASGYISKNSAPEILVEAIQYIAAGNRFIEPALATRCSLTVNQRPDEIDYQDLIGQLTSKEFDVLCLLAKGLTNHKIAEAMCMSYKTVANYSTQIKAKFNVATITELTHIALALGILKNQ